MLDTTLPQIANSLGDCARCCLAGCLAGSHVLLREGCHLLYRDGVTVGRLGAPNLFTVGRAAAFRSETGFAGKKQPINTRSCKCIFSSSAVEYTVTSGLTIASILSAFPASYVRFESMKDIGG